MGELSKKIGEQGELLIKEFLERIGWLHLQPSFDVDCLSPHEHKRKEAKEPRRTHGGDLLFSCLCPYIPAVRRNVIISVKNSNFEKTVEKVTLIEDDLKDLNTLLECFRFSPERANLQKRGGATSTSDMGLLIRINRDPDTQRSFVGDGGAQRLGLDGSNALYFVENDRFDFVDCCMDYLKRECNGRENSFYVHKNSLNLTGEARRLESEFLPVQNLVAGPIAVRSSLTGFRKLVIFCNEQFSRFSFERMVGLALSCSDGWASEVVVVADGYDRTKADIVSAVLSELDDARFASTIRCESFNVKSRLQ